MCPHTTRYLAASYYYISSGLILVNMRDVLRAVLMVAGAVLVTVRHAPNKNFGLNPQLLQPHADLGRGADGAYADLQRLRPTMLTYADVC